MLNTLKVRGCNRFLLRENTQKTQEESAALWVHMGMTALTLLQYKKNCFVIYRYNLCRLTHKAPITMYEDTF